MKIFKAWIWVELICPHTHHWNSAFVQIWVVTYIYIKFIFKRFLFYHEFVCLSVYLCPGVLGSQKDLLGPLGLVSQAVVSCLVWVLATSERAVSTLLTAKPSLQPHKLNVYVNIDAGWFSRTYLTAHQAVNLNLYFIHFIIYCNSGFLYTIM